MKEMSHRMFIITSCSSGTNHYERGLGFVVYNHLLYFKDQQLWICGGWDLIQEVVFALLNMSR